MDDNSKVFKVACSTNNVWAAWLYSHSWKGYSSKTALSWADDSGWGREGEECRPCSSEGRPDGEADQAQCKTWRAHIWKQVPFLRWAWSQILAIDRNLKSSLLEAERYREEYREVAEILALLKVCKIHIWTTDTLLFWCLSDTSRNERVVWCVIIVSL